jgi:membrane-bound serine protease (ClpP class)
MNTTERLFLAVIGTSLQEAVLFAIWRWGLPHIGIELPVYVLILGMIAVLVYSIVAFRFVSRTSNRKAVVGLPDMIDGKGKAVSPLSPEGQVRIKGEIWSAWATEKDIDRGQEIIVVGQDGLKLIVRRARNIGSERLRKVN